jgi:hypothetical protein
MGRDKGGRKDMTKEEALQKAIDVFGPRAGVTAGLQMKETGEDAVGVGFLEDGVLCIQGKGLDWEAAFAHAEWRRGKWQDRINSPSLMKPSAAEQAFQGVAVERKPVDVDLGSIHETLDEGFMERLKEKVRRANAEAEKFLEENT